MGEIHNLHFEPQKSYARKLFSFYRRVKAVKSLKKRIRPDVSISFMTQPNILNVVSKVKGERVFASIRNYPSLKQLEDKSFISKISNLIYPLVLRMADRIVTVSKGIEEFYKDEHKFLARKLRTIYNGVDVNSVNADSMDRLGGEFEKFFNSRLSLINVGKLEYQKGQKHLIEIFAKIIQNYDLRNTVLLILGAGKLAEELKEIAISNKLKVYVDGKDKFDTSANVFFFGSQKNPYKFIRTSDLFVLTSLYEGFPNVLIEAMACGLPIVSSDCPTGPSEILTGSDENFGVLLPSFYDSSTNSDIERQWVEELSLLLKDEQRRASFAALAKERVKEFDILNIITKWNELIDEK